MRTIKFRAFDDGKMIYSHNNMVNHSNNQNQWFFDKIREDAIVMQFTGLLDKNGNEIFEGDIITFSSTRHAEDFIIEVKYYAPSFGVPTKDDDNYDYLWENGIEIIGNIYENPELLPKQPSNH